MPLIRGVGLLDFWYLLSYVCRSRGTEHYSGGSTSGGWMSAYARELRFADDQGMQWANIEASINIFSSGSSTVSIGLHSCWN